MVRLNSALRIAGSLLSTTIAVSAVASSGFVADDGSVAFALNIPESNSNNDLYFTMSGPSSCSWISVGLGSDEMKGSLMFMMYADSSNKNITLSPRTVSGHVEPSHANIKVELQPGTGIYNNTMTANVRCFNCTSWKGGSLDVKNTKESFIWANGPPRTLKSNSLTAGVQRHDSYGVFTMDLTKAVGAAGVPDVPTKDSTGTRQVSEDADHDFTGAAHAVLMILVFVGLMPLGIVSLRFLNSPKWHAINQTVSLAVALLGAALGFYLGTLYNKTKNFNSGHQIFGLIIVLAMIAQFVLGFLHHRIYKKTSATTKLAPIHVWLGRVVIPAGIINGFIGFPLADNSRYNWALLACTLFVVIILTPFLFFGFRRRQNNKIKAIVTETEGYQAEPWRQAQEQGYGQSDINLGHMGANANANAGMPPAYAGGGQYQMHSQQQQMYGAPGQSTQNPPTVGRQFV
ncbi:integral membrane protein [Rutstroemia sp. NJR-2017a WRK4]|nr:integral membrane protein [Rutstroemia sp. NJR-2017a WRK4]